MAQEIKLPELGDGIESGTVVSVFVSKGDTIEKDQALLELETDKAVIEVPASESGKISKVLVSKGDEVDVGQAIVEIEGAGDGSAKEETQKEEKAEKPKQEEKESSEEPKQEKAPVEEEKKESKKSKSAGETINFKIPNLGDNIESGVVTSILVSEGDAVEKDQGLLELETDKAVVEVPSDIAGTIKKINVSQGDEVAVDQEVMVIESSGAEPVEEAEEAAEETKPEQKEEPKEEKAEKKKDVSPAAAATVSKDVPQQVFEPPRRGKLAPASPSVRRFAREIGLDIHDVPGSGPGGRISVEDVKSYAKMLNKQKGAGMAAGVQAEPLPDFSKWGETERESMSKLRQTGAKHLSYAWVSIPHVTQFDKADITELEKLRKANGKKAEAAGGKLTMTAILIKVIEAALRKFPQFNASVDMSKMEIIYKKYFNIGIAVDTPYGLVVPVLKNVEKKNIIDLSVELTEMSKKARDRKLSLEEMQGGNFSISNLGGIGGTGFTPIVNSPDVAILGVSRAAMEPKFVDGKFEPRLMMPLALSYDHKLIDGADAARFLRWVCEVLEEPFRVMLEG